MYLDVSLGANGFCTSAIRCGWCRQRVTLGTDEVAGASDVEQGGALPRCCGAGDDQRGAGGGLLMASQDHQGPHAGGESVDGRGAHPDERGTVGEAFLVAARRVTGSGWHRGRRGGERDSRGGGRGQSGGRSRSSRPGCATCASTARTARCSPLRPRPISPPGGRDRRNRCRIKIVRDTRRSTGHSHWSRLQRFPM